MAHAGTLEQTALWKYYSKKLKNDPERVGWTKKICEAACDYLKAVRDSFANFTLHDGTHVLNVLDAMAGLLGKQIRKLSEGEAELLLLAAALHDLGMVYTPEDSSCFADGDRLHQYTEALCPRLRGKRPEDWAEADRADFLRWLHPFRVDAVLARPEWRELMDRRPKDAAEEPVIVAVCRAHGEDPEWLREQATKVGANLNYLTASKTDPLFCALLLRLGDILDFDDSRAPLILFPYAKSSEKSVEEWKKHMGSSGFSYPEDGPNTNDLPYKGTFTDAGIERAARRFLDWIDTELYRSRSLLRLCHDRWKDFPFPFQVDRQELRSEGYDYGDFRVSMDQEKILELLTGENLYKDRSVFVRELLQNAIDATLLRAQMDPSFGAKLNSDAARIELWEWTDEEGELWFRIDDKGTGMTRGMLEKYFLKAGNSYYESEELKRDLEGGSFTGISRFGIGFLSCFLCGKDAQLSTLYCKPEKNRLEAEREPGRRIDREKFGLRLDVTGLKGFFTLRNQAFRNNRPAPFPAPPPAGPRPEPEAEEDGYRSEPGTSIAIRLDPGLLGTINLREVAEYWLCYPRMQVYYNGQRLGLTHDELLDLARAEQGTEEYELSAEAKRKFDEVVPELAGEYPTIRERIELLEAGQIPGLPKLTVILSETRISLKKDKFIRGGENHYLSVDSNHTTISISSDKERYGENLFVGPSPDPRRLRCGHGILAGRHYAYNGIELEKRLNLQNIESLVLDEDGARPSMYVDRGGIKALPLKTDVFLCLLEEKWRMRYAFLDHGSLRKTSLASWRSVLSEDFRAWAEIESMPDWKKLKKLSDMDMIERINTVYILRIMEFPGLEFQFARINRDTVDDFLIAALQTRFRMTVDYAEGQRIEYAEAAPGTVDARFDCFPPMPFCYGKTAADRAILCAENPIYRFAVTADHPFAEWLLAHGEQLRAHYPRQLEQMTEALCKYSSGTIISTVDQILEQLGKSAFRYGIDVSACPRLTAADFWEAPEL